MMNKHQFGGAFSVSNEDRIIGLTQEVGWLYDDVQKLKSRIKLLNFGLAAAIGFSIGLFFMIINR